MELVLVLILILVFFCCLNGAYTKADMEKASLYLVHKKGHENRHRERKAERETTKGTEGHFFSVPVIDPF